MRKNRYELPAPVSFTGPGFQGEGLILNISRSGVLIESPTQVPVGSQISLRASYYPGSMEDVVDCEVARLTKTGFAATFVNVSPSLARFIDSILP